MVHPPIFLFMSLVPSLLEVKVVYFMLPTNPPFSTCVMATSTYSDPTLFMLLSIWIMALLLMFSSVFLVGSHEWGLGLLFVDVGTNYFVVTCVCAVGVHGAYVVITVFIICWFSWLKNQCV